MSDRQAYFWVGLVVLLVGGAILAFGGPRAGTVLGTTLGLAGLGLMVWAWSGRSGGSAQ